MAICLAADILCGARYSVFTQADKSSQCPSDAKLFISHTGTLPIDRFVVGHAPMVVAHPAITRA